MKSAVVLTVQELVDGKKTFTMKTEQGKASGDIYFEHFKLIKKPSFLEVLKSGW